MKRWLFLPYTFLATLIASATSSLDVIGAGYGRTGTSSLREALDLLGYKTYHMQHVMKGKGHVNEWMSVLHGKQALCNVVDTVLEQAGYTATVDFPTVTYWQELARLYPNAKIILTERASPQEWWESASQTIFIPNLAARLLYIVAPFWRKFGKFLGLLWYKTFDLNRPRQLTREDRDVVILAYRKNSAAARAFDPRRVLVYQVSQGWEPLCEFLNMTIPNVPFPNVNSRKAFQTNMMTHFVWVAIPVLVVASAGVVGVVLCLMKRRPSPKRGKVA